MSATDSPSRAPAEAEKVRRRADGSIVLMCESGNPQLGLMLTPGCAGDAIASLPGDDGHPLSAVNVHLGPAQLAALAAFATRPTSAGSDPPPQ